MIVFFELLFNVINAHTKIFTHFVSSSEAVLLAKISFLCLRLLKKNLLKQNNLYLITHRLLSL